MRRLAFPAALPSTEYSQSLERFAPMPVRGGLALIGREWVRTDVSSVGQVVTVSEIPGAQLYRVEWWPLFHVFASIPPEALDSSNNSRTWQIVAEEI